MGKEEEEEEEDEDERGGGGGGEGSRQVRIKGSPTIGATGGRCSDAVAGGRHQWRSWFCDRSV